MKQAMRAGVRLGLALGDRRQRRLLPRRRRQARVVRRLRRQAEFGFQLSDTRHKGSVLRHEHLDPLQQGSDQGILVGGRGGRVHATLDSHHNAVVDPKIRPLPAPRRPQPHTGPRHVSNYQNRGQTYKPPIPLAKREVKNEGIPEPMEWYYSDGDTYEGPCSTDELKEHIKNNPALLVWSPGMDEWLEARQTDAFRSFIENTPPPLPKAKGGITSVKKREWPAPVISQNDVIEQRPSDYYVPGNSYCFRRLIARSLDIYLISLLLVMAFPKILNDATTTTQ